MAARALPGAAMSPLVMVLFTVMVGARSPFWRASLSLSASAIALLALRVWVTRRWESVPESAPAGPWRRAFELVTAANMAVLGGYIGYGNYVLGVGLSSAVMIFAGAAIMSGGL